MSNLLLINNLRKTTKKIERDVNKIMIGSGNYKFKVSVELKKAFAKDGPKKKLVLPFKTARGKMHLEFLSPEEADEVLDNWRPNYFGTGTTIRKVGERSDC